MEQYLWTIVCNGVVG